MKTRFTRVISLLLALLLVAGCSLTVFAADQDAQNKPFEVRSKSIKKSYEIAVAYDNSGSMYGAGNSRWYQAKYAMEIFASMLNFSDGDKLVIFPMHEVTVDNTRVDRIEVKSVADIDKVHNMYTPSAGGTPYSVVTTAHTYLKTSQADVKWLVVLTDGAFSGVSNLQSSLEQLARGNIYVRYIPFGGTVLADTDPKDNFYASPSVNGDDQLQAELISSCNQIFQRDELKGRLNGQKLTLDLSMKKVIVFVQGNGATVTALKDSSGNEIKKISDSKSRSYSEKGAGTTPTPIPEELKKRNGQVVMFDACPKGEYTLEYANADKIQIFYEPDVTMRIKFLNDDGIMADFESGKIEAGEYTYSVELVDSITGEDVTNHELLGGNVSVNDKVTYGDGRELDLQNGSKVTFDPSTNVNFDIEVEYLGKYKLSLKDISDINFNNIEITIPEAKLKVMPEILQAGGVYSLLEHENWKPVKVNLTMNDVPLTDDQLTAATIEFQSDCKGEKLRYRVEKLMGESAVNVYVAQDDKGNYVEPIKGKYTCTVKVTAPDEYGELIENTSAEFSLKVQLLPSWLWLILVLLAIALLIFILGLPAKPASVTLQFNNGRSQQIDLVDGFAVRRAQGRGNAFSFTPKVNMKWGRNAWIKNGFLGKFFNSSNMNFRATNISLEIGTTQLSITNDVLITNNMTISWKEKGVNRSARVRINY